jgi:hypothetical protein
MAQFIRVQPKLTSIRDDAKSQYPSVWAVPKSSHGFHATQGFIRREPLDTSTEAFLIILLD